MSSELKQLLRERKGYRCESYSGSGVRNAREILKFEIEENGNESMLKEACDALKTTKCSKKSVYKRLEGLTGIWLATKQGVERYCEGATPDEIKIPKKAIAISDLGDDGVLFVWKD